jgi:hypothetical protein
MRLCCCSAWRSCSKELSILYAPALSILDSWKLGWGVGVRSSINISSSSSSSADARGNPPHPREDPSRDGANILRRFAPWLDEGSDEIGSDSGTVDWASGNGDEARCRLSISMQREVRVILATAQSVRIPCETRRGDEQMKGVALRQTNCARNGSPLE